MKTACFMTLILAAMLALSCHLSPERSSSREYSSTVTERCDRIGWKECNMECFDGSEMVTYFAVSEEDYRIYMEKKDLRSITKVRLGELYTSICSQCIVTFTLYNDGNDTGRKVSCDEFYQYLEDYAATNHKRVVEVFCGINCSN